MSFSLSSQNILVKGGKLQAQSKRMDGTWNASTINLDLHIGNNNGNLEWDGENFSHSCQNIQLKDGHVLKADAKAKDGSWHSSTLDLNSRIGNNNGNLEYN